MSIPLVDALQNVDLELGKTHKVQVGDIWVVMLVLSSDEYQSASDWFFGKVMPPGSIYKSLYPRPIVITEDDLTPGYLGDEEK